MRYFFELTPIALAAVAFILCGLRYNSECKKHIKIPMLFGICASILLLFAQTSWWSSLILEGSTVGNAFTDYIWTVFNATVMVSFIYLAVNKNAS